jgi:hypothetical protein
MGEVSNPIPDGMSGMDFQNMMNGFNNMDYNQMMQMMAANGMGGLNPMMGKPTQAMKTLFDAYLQDQECLWE